MPPPPDGTAAPAPWRARLAGFALRWRNTGFSTLDHLWTLVLWAVSTPIFLDVLGADLFGVFLLINALIGLGGVMSFGFGEATMRFVAHYRGEGAPETARRVVETSASFYAATSLAFTTAIWLAAPWLAGRLFGLSGTLAAQAVGALEMAALALFVTAFLKTWEAAINGFERFDIPARIGMAARSAIILVNLALALAGFGLPALLTTTACVLGFQAAVLFWVVRGRFLPGLRILGWPDRAVTGDILRYGAQIWLQICASALANIVDRLLVGALVGPAAAGIYTVCLQLAQQIQLLLYRGLAFMIPAASRDRATNADPATLLDGYRTGAWLTLVLVAAICLPLHVLAEQILTIWVGRDFADAGTALLGWLVLYFGLYSGSVAGFMLVNGCGYPGWNSAAGLINGLVITGVAGLVLPAMGLDGIALARFAAAPAMLVTLYALHTRVLDGRGGAATLGLFAGIGLVGLLALLLRSWLAPLIPAQVVPTLAAAALLALSGAALVLLASLALRRRATRVPENTPVKTKG